MNSQFDAKMNGTKPPENSLKKFLQQYLSRRKISSDNIEHLMKLFKSSEINIVTVSRNFSDGIGDYVSQLYFIEKWNRIFGDCQNINIKNISLITNGKIATAKRMREGVIPENSVYTLDNPGLRQEEV